MREINDLLREYIEVPTAHSLPKKCYIPSPDMRPEALHDENLTPQQREHLLQQQMLYQQTGLKLQGRYEYDLRDVQEKKMQMDEFKFYRKKFEKSQRAKAVNTADAKDVTDKMAMLDLNKEMFDP